MTDTFFKLPTQPEEFGVALPPAQLRRLDFSALEFPTLRRALVEYIKTYFPDTFNDFVANNGIIMLMELVSYVGAILSTRSDLIADEAFLPTAISEEAVINHLKLVGQRIRRATPAIVDVEISVSAPLPTPIIISPGLQFNLTGPDGEELFYEIFRAPGDFTSTIVIQSGKRGIVAFGIEGIFADLVTVTSNGEPDQEIEILETDILDEPFIVEVTTGNEIVRWKRVDVIEQTNANDEVYEVRFTGDGVKIVFGNNIAGKIPLAGQEISVQFRRGGGIRGRISAGAINETRAIAPQPPASAPVEVLFRNLTPSSGGSDKETLDAAKRRAPREAATIQSAISGEDYALLASDFSSPIFGSTLKAVATVRTSINTNQVELHILAEGPGGTPVLPSSGLKQGLKTFFEQINVLTDEVIVLDGVIKPVDIEVTIVMSRNADAATVREQVIESVNRFFNVANFDLGSPLHLGNLYQAIQDVPGVSFATIFKPADDILPTDKLAGEGSPDGISINEILVLGQAKLDFFFERVGADRRITAI